MMLGRKVPRTALMCQNEVVADLKQRRTSVEKIIRIGHRHVKARLPTPWRNAAEEPVLRNKLRRKEVAALFEKLSPTVV